MRSIGPKGQVLADSITVQQAWRASAQAGRFRSLTLPIAGNTGFAYVQAGIRHEVWMLDALSAWNQLLVLRQVRPAGVALWRLGSEDPGYWPRSICGSGRRASSDQRT